MQGQFDENPQQNICEQILNEPEGQIYPPYEVPTDIQLMYDSMTTYNDLLKNEKYDGDLKAKISRLGGNLLIDKIYILAVSIQPQNIHYKIWKHPSEINRFMKQMGKEILVMESSHKRMGENGHVIVSKYNSLKNVGHWS